MTTSQFKAGVTELEAKVVSLEQELDYAQAVAGIKRGLEQAGRGLGTPARTWARKVRARHKLPKA